jgi:hypothetical protein
LLFHFLCCEVCFSVLIECNVLAQLFAGISQHFDSGSHFCLESATATVLGKVHFVGGKITHKFDFICLALQFFALKLLNTISLLLVMDVVSSYFLFQDIV